MLSLVHFVINFWYLYVFLTVCFLTWFCFWIYFVILFVASMFIFISPWFWCWANHLGMINVMITGTTFHHFHGIFVHFWLCDFFFFFFIKFLLFCFCEKLLSLLFSSSQVSVIFAKNCDQNSVELCENQRKTPDH